MGRRFSYNKSEDLPINQCLELRMQGSQKALYRLKMTRYIFYSFFSITLCVTSHLLAQYAPGVGITGTTAMYKDSSAFVAWANSARVYKGFQDISNPGLGYVNVGDSTCAYGIAGTTGVVSLGDAGYAILQFPNTIVDLPGPDFAVFENSFSDTFLELAFVEVSSDGEHFFRFPASSLTDTSVQTGSFGLTDPTKIHNLAGKYRANYGTPFSLEDIADTSMLNKQAITHVKIIDVVGCMQNQYCTRDANNRKVNDPWPTAFASSGFDLDAVGVIHQQTTVGIDEFLFMQVMIYPNPVTDVLYILGDNRQPYDVIVTDVLGNEIITLQQQVLRTTINTTALSKGIYFINIDNSNAKKQWRILKSE